MKVLIDARLAATEKELGEIYLPRIIRLCRKLKLSEMDTEIAIYSLVVQSGGVKFDLHSKWNVICSSY